MVEEGNLCHLNITESTLVKGPLPQGVHMSLFTGCRQYLCMSNLSKEVQTLVLDGVWKDCESGIAAPAVTLQPRRVHFLEKVG